MPLIGLNISGNPISDLGPLRGMKLGTLICENCPVEDIEPIRDMPLTLLNLSGCRITSIEPLRGMQINFLACSCNPFGTLEPLTDMQSLVGIHCSACNLESLEPLRGLPVSSINCSGNAIRSLEPLSDMPLTVLHCCDNKIEDLEPLRGLQLKMLSCHANKVKSLEPLAGMPLVSLICGQNPLTSVSEFEDDPPDDFRFDCDGIPDADLEHLLAKWSPVPEFVIHVQNLRVLLALRKNDMKELRSLSSEFEGHHVLFIPKFLCWEEAEAFCRKLGGHLITIASREKNEFVDTLFPNGTWAWMGLYTRSGGHEWVTGEPFEYANFVDPIHEHRLGPKIFSSRWTCDDAPNPHNSFIIEWDD